MSFEYMNVTGIVYQNMSIYPEIAETFSGQWFYAKRGVLSMDITYSNSLKAGTEEFYVLQCDDKTLKVRHTKLGLTFDFYKIVESYNARIGDRFVIGYAKNHSDFSSAIYTTSNGDIADVDGNGNVTVKGGGQAFITVSSSAGTVVVRVDSGQHIDSYTAEISETIDQVIARHGEPDITTSINTGSLVIGYETPEKIMDTAIRLVGYAYDPDTREVTLIEIHYSSEADKWFQADEEYLNRDFYNYLDNAATYAPNQSLQDNHFYISIVKAASGNGLFIFNRDYISTHGHY